ncbi:hypothetical protein INT47_001928 [Mucor saturninus]|uniref:Alginate lyase domain-containing protein n=1 Tax=Mucor saturninus TaxID=64648 RepID=A0A8H7V776_9FUNG|nr:hypothetical protein INT47_001928 [Mucor saturninus]
MGPRKPELEYISFRNLRSQRQAGQTELTKDAYKALEKLADGALKSGPFSITFEKKFPHIAPSGDVSDFLSYAPYWWPDDTNTKYIRKDGKRNPGCVKDQSQLESFAESFTFLCLGYYFLNNENYAIYAVSLLDTFFLNEKTRMNPNLNYAQFVRGSQNTTKMGRGEGVISSRVLSRIANLLPLLDAFHAYYAINQYIKLWFANYLNWLTTSPVALQASKSKNNIYTWYIVQKASIDFYLNPISTKPSNLIVDFFMNDLQKQIDPRTGNQPLESKRTKPFHYLAFNMQAILYLAELAKDIGLNVYNSNNLIHSAIHYITSFGNDPNQKEDITQAVRCVEIVLKRLNDHDNCCKQFIHTAYHCKYSDKIGGPKNAINALWSPIN